VKVLLYEHACGSGFNLSVEPNVLSEGFGMLRSVASDFKRAGHQVTVLLDDYLSKLNPPIDADYVVPVTSPFEPQKFLSTLAYVNDFIYIIAPETKQTLLSLVQTIEKTGKTSLNTPSETINKSSNKAVLHETLKKLGVPALDTVAFNGQASLSGVKREIMDRLNFPLVLKPLDGVSCAGICLIKSASQIESATKKMGTSGFVAQKYVKGVDVSVSLLCTGTEALAISLNRQNIALEEPELESSYVGGCVPFNHPKKPEAFRVAKKIAVHFGLRGYVGIDFVLTDEAAYAVDVNPRLTTSYVGLNKTASVNVAQAIIDAIYAKKLPKNIEFSGYACFSKVQTANPTTNELKLMFNLPQIVSPPFPNKKGTYALVYGYGDSELKSVLSVQEAKKHLHQIIKGGT
jgi:tyramine---L-glutamate ligase